MIVDPRLVAKWAAEYQELEKKRKEQGLTPLTVEEAQRHGFQDGMRDVKAIQKGEADNLTSQCAEAIRSANVARDRSATWTLSVRITILFILIAIGLATCGRMLLR